MELIVFSTIGYIYNLFITAAAIVNLQLDLQSTILAVIVAELLCNIFPIIFKSYRKYFTTFSHFLRHGLVIASVIDDFFNSRSNGLFFFFASVYLVLCVICTVLGVYDKRANPEKYQENAPGPKSSNVVIYRNQNEGKIADEPQLCKNDVEPLPSYIEDNKRIIRKIAEDVVFKGMTEFSHGVKEAFSLRVFAELLPLSEKAKLSLTEVDQAAWRCLYSLVTAKIPEDDKYYGAATICKNHIDETYIPKQAKPDEPRLSFDKLARRSYIASKISGLLSELLPLCSEKEKEPIFDTLFEWFLEVIDDPRFNDDEFNSAVWGILHHTIRGKRNNPRYSKAVEICEEKIAENFRKETLALYNKEFSTVNESEKLFIRILRNDVSQCMQNFSENATEAYVAQAMLFIRTTIGYDYTPEEMTLICWEVLKTIFESDLKENEDFSVPLQVCEKNINMITKG